MRLGHTGSPPSPITRCQRSTPDRAGKASLTRTLTVATLWGGILWGLWSGQTDWLYYPTEAACRGALRGIADEGVLWVIECRPMTEGERRAEASRQWPDPTLMKPMLDRPPSRIPRVGSEPRR
jgi:hypothetical protein